MCKEVGSREAATDEVKGSRAESQEGYERNYHEKKCMDEDTHGVDLLDGIAAELDVIVESAVVRDEGSREHRKQDEGHSVLHGYQAPVAERRDTGSEKVHRENEWEREEAHSEEPVDDRARRECRPPDAQEQEGLKRLGVEQ